jgi:hypothetical protein
MSKKPVTTLLAAFALAILLAGSAPAQTPSAAPVGSKLPRIQVSAEEFDFGRVPQGASISHVFWIKNVGEDTLRITDVKPG